MPRRPRLTTGPLPATTTIYKTVQCLFIGTLGYEYSTQRERGEHYTRSYGMIQVQHAHGNTHAHTDTDRTRNTEMSAAAAAAAALAWWGLVVFGAACRDRAVKNGCCLEGQQEEQVVIYSHSVSATPPPPPPLLSPPLHAPLSRKAEGTVRFVGTAERRE